MPRIADHEIERLKAEVSLVRLVESSGIVLEKRGDERVGRCPFHADDTPSLSVSVSKNLFRCFGCEAGGGPIDWVMKRDGVSFRHAVELLRQGVPAAPGPDASPVRRTGRLSAASRAGNGEVGVGETLAYDPVRSGSGPVRSPPGRGSVGARSGAGRAGETAPAPCESAVPAVARAEPLKTHVTPLNGAGRSYPQPPLAAAL